MIDEIVRIIDLWFSPDSDEITEEQLMYKLQKMLPHVQIQSYLTKNWSPTIGTVELAQQLIDLEASLINEPAPPFITHEGLVDNVGWLRDQYEDYGEFPLYVLVPLELEYPKARIAEMLSTTHAESSAEKIVAEIYRRQAEPDPAPPP